VSDAHTDLARGVLLPGAIKVVLMILACRACRFCGLCWPGIRILKDECGLGETRLRDSLEALAADDRGLLKIHAYPHGGRGRATEYIVLPGLMELSTAPCGKCRSNMKTPREAMGIDRSVTPIPLATRGVSTKPLAKTVKTPRTGTDQPEVEPSTGRALRARAVDSPPARTMSHPTLPLTNAEWSQNAQQAARLARHFGPTPQPESPATGNDDSLSAETASRQGEAQGDGQTDGLESGSEAEETETD
jgi:hypothetical protein